MARFDPAKIASKWLKNGQSANQDYLDGVDGVQEAPGLAAVAHQDALKQRFNQAVDNGTWAKNTAGVDLPTWKTQTKKKGGARFSDGIAAGASKYQRYINAAAPRYADIKAQIAAMPNATDADREARMRANLQLMRAMKGVGR